MTEKKRKNISNFRAKKPSFEYFTREQDVSFYTVFSTIALPKSVLIILQLKLMLRHVGKTRRKSYQQRINTILSSPFYDPNDLPPVNRKEPKKKFSLGQEFLLIMSIKNYNNMDKAITKEFSCLIISPSTGQIQLF